MQFRINATDAGTIMNANRYQSAYELWLIKTGRQNKPDLALKESVQWGIRLESVILDQVLAEKGLPPAKPESQQVWLEVNAGFPMTGYVDYFDGKLLVEIKTANAYALKEWQECVPCNYYWQVMHYLILTKMDKALIACLVGGQTLVKHWVEYNREDATMLIEAEKSFYNCLVNDIEPPMQDTVPAETVIDMDADTERLCAAYKQANGLIAEIDKRKKELAENIKVLVGKNATSTGNAYKASYKFYPQAKFDDKALADAEPEIYAKYIKESGFYRLDIKEIK
jgi:predicted phage-related endonuclease